MKLPYFKLGKAFDDIKNEFTSGSVIDKASAIAKFTGKTVANVGLLAVEAGVFVVTNPKEISGKIAESNLNKGLNYTNEQKSKLKEAVEVGREARVMREKRDVKEAEKEKSKKK